LLLFLLLPTGFVRAAPTGIDQTPPAGGSFLVDGLVLLAAILAAILIFRFRWYVLVAAPRRSRLFAPEVGLALILAMLVLGPIGARLTQYAWGISTVDEAGSPIDLSLADQAKLFLGAYAGQGLVLLAYLWRMARSHRPSPDARFGRGRAALLGAAALLAAWPLAAAFGWAAATIGSWITGRLPDPIAHETLRALLDSPADGWLIVVSALVVIATPVLEELLYRGLLQETLRSLGVGRWPAIIAASVVFALMHWQNTAPHAVLSLFVLSLGFGWVYERTGRLTASIVMHMLFNLGNLSLAMLWLPNQPL
jgi:membrane protease YdiL (CAAX protease family)